MIVIGRRTWTRPNEESGIFAEVPRASKQHEDFGVGSPAGSVAKQRTSAQEETNKV